MNIEVLKVQKYSRNYIKGNKKIKTHSRNFYTTTNSAQEISYYLDTF